MFLPFDWGNDGFMTYFGSLVTPVLASQLPPRYISREKGS